MRKLLVLGLLSLGASALVFSRPPLAQDPAYHAFANQASWLGLPNWQNVASNLPFLLVGLGGLALVWRRRREPEPERAAWALLFLGFVLTAFGSSYYHWQPNNETLLWDRLPMSLAFMALFSSIIGERISYRAYQFLLGPLVAAGVGSVVYWYCGEAAGHGDLRPYVLVQFFPLLSLPVIMWLYPARYTHGRLIFAALAAYLSAKALEYFDVPVFNFSGGVVGGHALKHLAAALGCFFLMRLYQVRRPLLVVAAQPQS